MAFQLGREGRAGGGEGGHGVSVEKSPGLGLVGLLGGLDLGFPAVPLAGLSTLQLPEMTGRGAWVVTMGRS